jgi:NAD(P)-dependent dehydrogenase (short-subunit alcohol dehydrogenase family)
VALAQAGLDVGVTWKSDDSGAQETAEEIRSLGRRAVVAQLDLTDLPGCGDVIDSMADELGGVDVFVNNSGTGASVALIDMTFEQWREVVATDLDGAFVCIQRAARRMAAAGRGGRIICTTSVHEHVPRVGSSAYDAAKHGLGGLVKTAALELGRHGITVNSVAPGEIATPMTGQEDADPHGADRRASRSGARAMRGRWRRSSGSSRHRSPRTSRGHRGSSTAGWYRWARRPDRTSRATNGGHPTSSN